LKVNGEYCVCYFATAMSREGRPFYYCYQSPNGTSFVDWFCNYIDQLSKGVYPIENGLPLNFPKNPAFVAITGNIKVIKKFTVANLISILIVLISIQLVGSCNMLAA